MAPYHRRRIGASRRTVDDEGEEDSFPATVEDDSLSEATVSSQSHDEDDGDEVDRGDGHGEITETEGEKAVLESGRSVRTDREGRARTARGRGNLKEGGGGEGNGLFNARTAETDAMMNGSKETAGPVQEADEIHFDRLADPWPSSGGGDGGNNGAGSQRESFTERKRREHGEYIQKRNSDPSFVPTRGGFFLHDNRSGNGNGSGRGKQMKGKPHGLIVDSNVFRKPQPDITHTPWRHDLHDSVNRPPYRPPQSTTNNGSSNSYPSKPVPTAPRTSPPNRSFSSTILIGNVPVIVSLPGMESPISFSAVPKKQHTRLPQHRPPLRRDKPVRISLPGQAPRYIFPSTERSFIFIPRALRPNQQASYRGRGRGGGGGFYSRRTSVYSGSVYSHAPTHTPSASLSMSMSRRSSMGRDVSVNGATPPLGSTVPMSRPVVPDARPVVRLPPQAMPAQVQQQQQPQQPQQPPGPPQAPAQTQPTAVPTPASTAPFFPPQNPTYRENRPHPSIPIHQPRPQKTVSVADIESPAASASAYQFAQQQTDQPFHHQVPHQMPMNGFAPTPDMTMPMAMPVPIPMQVPMVMPMQQMPVYSHMRHMSHPPPTSATPLSQIPERAIHAAPFQPIPYQQPQMAAQPGQQAYYGQPYPAGPMYAVPPAPGTEYPYTPGGAGPAGPGTVAHESNGTVYYYDASQMTAPGSSSGASVGGQPPAPSQGQGVVGMGGMMTPPGPTYYYPPQMPVQQNGPVYYQ
ncbi:hypothetical protein MferCBS31731_005658 [Microsporum ferrugineum]